MHSFKDLELKTLKKICSKYNLHMKIARYSKLSKEELIPHMEKHLHINKDGKINIKIMAVDDAEDQLDKMIDELKNKVKEVKEKVIKHHAKKQKKEIQIEEKKEDTKEDKIINFLKKEGFQDKPKKEIQIDEMTKKEKAKKILKHYSDISNWEASKRRERLTAFKNMINEGLLEEILKVKHLNLFYKRYENYLKGEKKEDAKEDKKEKKQKKTEEQIKEEEIIEALPMYHKLNDYEGVERVTKLNDMCLKMEHFPTIVKCLEGIEEYLEKHPEADKPKKEKKKEIQIDDNDNYMQEEKKRKEKIKKDEMKKFYMDKIKEEEIQINIDMKELKILEDKKTKTDKQKIKIQQLKDFIKIGNDKIEEIKKKLPEEEKNPMDKIEKIENIVDKLENIMNINKKEMKKPKHDESDSEEEFIPMKPKTASNVNSLKVSELKELAKKHNISLKHKVNNKEVAKGAPMLRKEIIKYLKL